MIEREVYQLIELSNSLKLIQDALRKLEGCIEYFHGEALDNILNKNNRMPLPKKPAGDPFWFAPNDLLSESAKIVIAESVKEYQNTVDFINKLQSIKFPISMDIYNQISSMHETKFINKALKDQPIYEWWNHLLHQQLNFGAYDPPQFISLILLSHENTDLLKYITWFIYSHSKNWLSLNQTDTHKKLRSLAMSFNRQEIVTKCHITALDQNRLFDLNNGVIYLSKQPMNQNLSSMASQLLDIKPTEFPCMVCFSTIFSRPEIIIDLNNLPFEEIYKKMGDFVRQIDNPFTSDDGMSMLYPPLWVRYYKTTFKDRVFSYTYGKRIDQVSLSSDDEIRNRPKTINNYFDLCYNLLKEYKFELLPQ